jgi:membrane fusion protein, macrolide-specific efflux system
MVRFIIASFVLAGCVVGGWLYFRDAASSSRQYVTATVTRGDVEDVVIATGTLQPLEYVDVGTQVSGQLRKIHVQIGDQVKRGDLLAEIDPTVFQARVDADRANLLRLNAELAEKQAQRRLAEQQFRRQEGLLRGNATSQEAHQSAEAALRVAEAQIESLKAQVTQTQSTLKGNEANLGYTKIYAPMDGTVVSLTARQGQTLNANQQAPIVLRIADLETMTVSTQVSEADIGRLKLGMEAYFTTLGQPNRRWYGKLRQILPTPEVVNNVVLYNALFDVANPGQALKTQMSAQAFFVLASAKDVLTVPTAALRGAVGPEREDGARKHKVQVLLESGAVEERTVTVGARNRIAAEIVEGLSEGETVVLRERETSNAQGRPVRARL